MDAEHNCYPDCRCGNIRRPCHIEHGNTLAIEAERAQRWVRIPTQLAASSIFGSGSQRSTDACAPILTIAAEIGSIDKRIHAWHRSCEDSRRLEQIPGIGPIVATAPVAEIGDWKAFRSGRNLAAWIGLVPKQHSTGGKERLGSITKQGNRYLRWLLVAGAMAVIRYARRTSRSGSGLHE